MEASQIIKKLDQIENLPTLPTIAMEVNKLVQNQDTSIKELSSVIEKDQAIVSKILKLVNSAFFGMSSKVSNIPHAVMLLGFNAIRNAVVSVSVINAFDKIIYRKATFLIGNLRMQNNLEQQIAKLFSHTVHIICINCF